jgi:glycosyltransferase involved in cell wall biosynthesis
MADPVVASGESVGMSEPTVSVVIPSYNYGHFVTEAVESVLAQTWRASEIIVVDDGSTDDTRQRLQPYADRVRYLYQANQGLPAARNTGIRASRGDHVALLDSDDKWHPRKLEFQVACLARRPEVALVAGKVAADLQTGWPDLGDPAQAVARPVTAHELMIRSRFGPSGVLIRKECFETVGLFDTSLRSAEDRDMWIRIAGRYPVVRLEAPVWWYRKHEMSMSRAAARMEEYELKVLGKAFASTESFRRDVWLRRKAYGQAAKAAAYRYESAGLRLRGLHRLLRSLLLWPFPYSSEEALTRFERPKMLALFLLRALRGDPRIAPAAAETRCPRP